MQVLKLVLVYGGFIGQDRNFFSLLDMRIISRGIRDFIDTIVTSPCTVTVHFNYCELPRGRSWPLTHTMPPYTQIFQARLPSPMLMKNMAKDKNKGQKEKLHWFNHYFHVGDSLARPHSLVFTIFSHAAQKYVAHLSMHRGALREYFSHPCPAAWFGAEITLISEAENQPPGISIFLIRFSE